MHSRDYLVEGADDIFIVLYGKCRVNACQITDFCDIFGKCVAAVLAELLIRKTECIRLGRLSAESAQPAPVLTDVG